MSGRFFIMVCTNRTEADCLKLSLFGGKQDYYEHYKGIRKGDTGFLLNMETGVLLGVFESVSQAEFNIEPNAWNGRFPIQVRVKARGEVQRSERGLQILKEIGLIRPGKQAPSYAAYDDNIKLENLLAYFGPTEPSSTQPLSDESPGESLIEQPITFSDVIGLEDAKAFIRERMIEPTIALELAREYRVRLGGGLLLFGPPGTGKTLLARATSNELDARFEEISPSIIRGFPGDAERALERLFSSLRDSPRAVLFIDEAEALLAKREGQTSTVMQRVIPVLLSQFSLASKNRENPFLIIAASNAPWDIDNAFLRPGRLDMRRYVGPPQGESLWKILELCLRQRPISDDFQKEMNKKLLSEKLKGFTGADIQAITDRSAILAFRDAKASRERIPITPESILKIIESWPKSVTPADEKKYLDWQTARGCDFQSI
jgi:transitional endoplasmic reticulum ATPase